jgi:AcrR family transcriptional regulator
MTATAEDKRADLREKLVALAESRIAADGVDALRARDLATGAGCALGAIYGAVGDLGELVAEVNRRTLARMTEAMMAAETTDDPATRLIALSKTYHRFADANQNLWRCLFDRSGHADWFRVALEPLHDLYDAPLAIALPRLNPPRRAHLSRAMFAAVHGIVHLHSGPGHLPAGQIDRMLALLMRNLDTRSGAAA